MVLFLIGLILSIAVIAVLIYKIKKFYKEKIPGNNNRKLEGKDRNFIFLLNVLLGITNIISSIGLVNKNGWDLKSDYVFLIIGSLIFGLGIAIFITSFGLFYWATDLEEKQKKICAILRIVSPIIALIGLWLLSEGIANQDIYPLINRFDFENGFVRNVYLCREAGTRGGIQFYGVILVSGALLCYFITDHETYKKFGEHGLIDTLFIVAFLAGVVGSRLWYCLILEPDQFLSNPITIITGITDGGLAIQGGALGGALIGIIFVLVFRKYIDVRFLMDIAIPSILLAQAIGRWGNFFNQEVYGSVAPDWLMNILPTIIRKNMYITSPIDGIAVYRVPLFLIESLINFVGYFFIRYFLGKVCKFGVGKGYQAAAYLCWYGLVRFALEPLREGFTLNVGSSEAFGYMQSWITAIAMFVGGIVLFIILFLIHKIRMNKGLEDSNGDKIKVTTK